MLCLVIVKCKDKEFAVLLLFEYVLWGVVTWQRPELIKAQVLYPQVSLEAISSHSLYRVISLSVN